MREAMRELKSTGDYLHESVDVQRAAAVPTEPWLITAPAWAHHMQQVSHAGEGGVELIQDDGAPAQQI